MNLNNSISILYQFTVYLHYLQCSIMIKYLTVNTVNEKTHFVNEMVFDNQGFKNSIYSIYNIYSFLSDYPWCKKIEVFKAGRT